MTHVSLLLREARLSWLLAFSLQGVVPAVTARTLALGWCWALPPSLPSRTFRQIPHCLYQSGPTDWASEDAGKFRSVEFLGLSGTPAEAGPDPWCHQEVLELRLWAPPGTPSSDPVDLGMNPEHCGNQ